MKYQKINSEIKKYGLLASLLLGTTFSIGNDKSNEEGSQEKNKNGPEIYYIMMMVAGGAAVIGANYLDERKKSK